MKSLLITLVRYITLLLIGVGGVYFLQIGDYLLGGACMLVFVFSAVLPSAAFSNSESIEQSEDFADNQWKVEADRGTYASIDKPGLEENSRFR